MIGEAIRPELVAALCRGAGIKAQGQVDLATLITPVMIVEDISKGPFPPSRIWMTGHSVAASVGNISHIAVGNFDKPGAGSSATVDYILCAPGAADNLAVCVTQVIAPLFASAINVRECSNESGGLPAGSAADPQIANLQSSVSVSAAALNGAVFPHNSTNVLRLDGPWTLGPGGALAVRCQSPNIALVAFFKGRYHAGI